jgi:hypothetical protein
MTNYRQDRMGRTR